MTVLSLRQYFQLEVADPIQGVRSCCVPGMRNISLRSLMTSLRIIHISDLHFTDSSHTLNSDDNGIYFDAQDSKFRSDTIASYLINNKSRFGTNKVIITGDSTDSGDDNDYKIAHNFVQKLKDNGFEVYTVPGNHDYCKEGLIVWNTVVDEGLKARFCIWCPIKAICLVEVGTGIDILPDDKCLIRVFGIDNASKGERRQRFIHYITQYSQYPHIIDFDNGRLILLDSMQAELDESTGDVFAQGKLGNTQLDGSSGLSHLIDEYQEKRKKGKKIIVCLHHSPFATDSKMCLKDANKFLEIIYNKIDCLLFGHTSPGGVFQQPRPHLDEEFEIYEKTNKISLINVENLENVSKGSSYPITVLSLGSLRRIVYNTDGSKPYISWGNLTR